MKTAVATSSQAGPVREYLARSMCDSSRQVADLAPRKPVTPFRIAFSRRKLSQALIVIVVSVLLMTAARFLLPLGDEPDFHTSVFGVLYDEHSVFSPFYYFQPFFLEDMALVTQTTTLSIFYRLTLSLTIALPLYLYLIKASVKRSVARVSAERHDYIALSLLFPSIWFHLGILGKESLILVILLLIFCTDSRWLKFALFVIAVYVDMGDSIVFAYYWVLYRVYLWIFKHRGTKFAWMALILLALGSYAFSMSLLTLLTWIPVVGDRAAVIFDHYTNIYTDVNSKYPLFLRPIMTFMGMVFMLPKSQLMVIPAYVLAIFLVCAMVTRLSRRHKGHNEAVAAIYAGIALVVSMPMILPGFSNAKYYVFIIPIVLRAFLITFEKRDVVLWVLIFNVLVFATLLLNSSDSQESLL